MTGVTVRCPACRELARVDASSLEQLVQCPRCAEPFVALEEAELVAATVRQPAVPRFRSPEADTPPPQEPTTQPEADYDPHRNPPGTLPVSVMIGLALLPFAIPILWLLAPAVLGQEPSLSWAVPLALAVSTSILCLAVIYTIDWTPATRVKGVLMMVGLAYFAAVNLYFLKKQMVDEVKKFFGSGNDWVRFARGDGYQVKMPTEPTQVDEQPLRPLAILTCYKATYRTPFIGHFDFIAASGMPQRLVNGPEPGTDAWYDLACGQIIDRGGQMTAKNIVTHQDYSGRELVIELVGGNVRIVRIFVIKGRVYYLCVEGPRLTDDDEMVTEFFDSFLVLNAKD